MGQSIYFRTCEEMMAGRIVTGEDILMEYEKHLMNLLLM